VLVFGLLTKNLHAKLLIITFILVLYGFLGFWDDSIKLWKKQNEGLKAWQKFLGQVVGALLFVFVFVNEILPLYVSLFRHEVHIGLVIYTLYAIFLLVGYSNAVNLTDGIDLLISRQAIIAFATYGIIAHYQGQFDVLLFCATVIGALLG